ncbi:MbcA/ParS/Xre antitoxin family protein [Salinisphaera sp. SWV1]|uniref:MbcA/ParS/Xre antitoxin family protein n=1 Tax=Salinisphaera sp. SWV1 TaxID=3454139 RepID=UPI003F834FC8
MLIAQNAHPEANRAVHRSNAAAKAVIRMADLWKLTEVDIATLMGGVSIATVRRWRRQLREQGQIRGALTRDQLDRASYLLGIYKALHILFPDEAQADGWLHRPVDSPYFEGRSALDVMRQGGMNDLRLVRRFLDGWRA